MIEKVDRICQVCGSNVGFTQSDDGFFYCGYCNSQADDIFDTGLDDEQFFNHYSASFARALPTNVIYAEPISQVKLTTSQYLDHPDILEEATGNGLDDEDWLAGPSDFGSVKKNFSYEEYYSEIRSRLVTGLQVMIQLQCQALVEEFSVSPLIVGLSGTLWLRFLASTRVMADDWADRAVHDSEVQTQGVEAEEFHPSAQYHEEPVNIHGKRIVYVWYKSLRSTIPISCTLAISFLACHVAREAILPSDMLTWSLEGKLPYFSAFAEIDKQLGPRSEACPIPPSRMFRANHPMSLQKLESMAANIAKKIGLELPPVNFYAIASRYCQQLSLPSEDVIPLSCRICEWSMPAELYLSANEFRIPTRACVMSILIVAIRILFDINGYGLWESSLSTTPTSSQPTNADAASLTHVETTEDANVSGCSNNQELFGVEIGNHDSRSRAVKLLQILKAKHKETDVPVYSSSLSAYLQYCREVVFSGLWPSYEDLEEEKLIEELWEFYEKNMPVGTVDDDQGSSELNQKRFGCTNGSRQEESQKKKCRVGQSTRDGNSTSQSDSPDQDVCGTDHPPKESPKDEVIKKLKLDMEDHKFCYIAPRVKVKRKDYLHYARRRKGVYVYAVHADYYILLKSCAKVAQIEARMMHIAVLSLERRLQWLEKRIDSSMAFVGPELDWGCNLCNKNDESVQNEGIDTENNCASNWHQTPRHQLNAEWLPLCWFPC